jgi:hypothetical protein
MLQTGACCASRRDIDNGWYSPRWTLKTITRFWRGADGGRQGDQGRLPQAGAQIPPRRQQGKDAEAKFKDASEAYEALKSADKRAEYDELRKYGQHGQPFQGPPGWQSRGGFGGGGGAGTGDFSDFFSSIFGGRGDAFGGGQRRSAGRKGQDVEMELSVFLEETLSNESKQISFQVPHNDAWAGMSATPPRA